MKRTLAVLIGLVMITGFATAQSHGGLMTADHPLYSAKMAGETGVENLASNDTEEAEVKVKHASERANETRQLAEENKSELANETANAYAEEMQEVNDLGNQVSDMAQKQQIDELVATATQHHADVLATVRDRVPEQARKGIDKALNRAAAGYENAVNAMQQRGQPTDGIGNMSDHIPSDVQDQAGIDLSGVGGPDAGDQSNTSAGEPDNAGPDQ